MKLIYCNAAVAGIAIIFITACSIPGKLKMPTYESLAFSEPGSASVPSRWWEAFESQELNNHIQRSLENNFSLAAAWDRVLAARALAWQQSTSILPHLNFEGSSRRTSEAGAKTDASEIGLAASFELDIWGKIRHQSYAERLRAKATDAAYQTAALTLSSDIVLTWVHLVEAHQQLALLSKQIDTSKKVFTVLLARFGIGFLRSEDVLRQKLLIEATEKEKMDLEVLVQVLEHQLAVLQGQTPQGKTFEVASSLPTMPPLPQTGLPSQLLQRRPDIQQAYFELQAADKDLAASVRDQFPSLSLSGSYSSGTIKAGEVFSNWIASIAAGLVAPIIDWGARVAEVERKKSIRSQLLNDYRHAVLNAFQEVEDALIRESKQQEVLRNLKSRLETARLTSQQIQVGYLNGASEFISVLSAQIELQGLERDFLAAQRNLIEFRIALYRALAGGFETPNRV